MKFSGRVPSHLTRNRLTEALDARRAAGQPIIDLTLSNPTRADFDYPPDLLAPLSDARALIYDPQPLGLIDARRAIAREYERQGLEVSPDRIILTASTSDAYSLLFKLLANPGDEILVPRPSYPLFDHLTALEAVVTRPYDLDHHGSWAIDFASLEHGLTDRTRAILIVSPNNPTGSFITRDELDRLAAMCKGRRRTGKLDTVDVADIVIVADEVFADYELEPGAARAAGRVSSRHDVLSFALGGLSKSIGLPQVKLGWVAVSGPDDLVGAAVDRLELICDTYLSVGTPVQRALPALLASGAELRAQIGKRVVANRQRLAATFGRNSPCTLLPAEGGWSAILRVPALMSDEDWAVTLLDRDGVLVQPGYFFDLELGTTLVLSLLTHPATLAEGARRIAARVDAGSG